MDFVILALIIIVILIFFFRKEIRNKISSDNKKNYTIDDLYNSAKRNREREIDQLLSKIGKNGLDDLSPKDKARLDELSKK